MDTVVCESLKINKFVVKWLSFITMKNATNIEKDAFRRLERVLFNEIKNKELSNVQ